MHDTTQYAREFFRMYKIELTANILSRMFSYAKYLLLANKRCMTFSIAAKNRLP